jgi:hypothetical protein
VNLKVSIDFVLKHQQADGGFPYAASGRSALEPTAWSLLALAIHDPKTVALQKGAAYLASLQNRDGGWFLFRGDNLSSAYGTALAILALKTIDAAGFRPALEAGAFYLRNDHRFVRNTDLDEDVWGWNDYTFIGSEPTAMAVLALKHLGPLPPDRVEQAARFFSHTRCDYGGWSYGAPTDKNDPQSASPVCAVLPPQLHVTALVLLAMQDRPAEFKGELKIVSEECPKSHCPFSLSLGALALSCYGAANRDVLDRLNALMDRDGQVRGMVFYHALAALANLAAPGRNPLCLKR